MTEQIQRPAFNVSFKKQKESSNFKDERNSVALKLQESPSLHDSVDNLEHTKDFFSGGTNQDLGNPIGQIHDIFIISQNTKGIIIVDMHAAHERINYENLKKQWLKNSVISQRCLIPLKIQLSDFEVDFFESKLQSINRLGFDLIQSGENCISVHSHPVIIKETQIEEIIVDLIATMPDLESDLYEQKIFEILANIACKSSLRAYDRISIEKMNDLLRKIERTANSGYCSHGRPVWRFMSISELDRIFMRGQ